MARQIADNLSYRGPKPLDDRIVVSRLYELEFLNTYAYDGMVVYVKFEGAFYVYDSRIHTADYEDDNPNCFAGWSKLNDVMYGYTKWYKSEDVLPTTEASPNIVMLKDTEYNELVNRPNKVIEYDDHAYEYVSTVDGSTKDGDPCTYMIYQCICVAAEDPVKPDSDRKLVVRTLEITSQSYFLNAPKPYGEAERGRYYYTYPHVVPIGGNGGGVKFVETLPTEGLVEGDLYGIRAYKYRSKFYRMPQSEIDAGSGWLGDSLRLNNVGATYTKAELLTNFEMLTTTGGFTQVPEYQMDKYCFVLYFDHNGDRHIESPMAYRDIYRPEIYVCTGTGFHRIYPDAEGNPVSRVSVSKEQYRKIKEGEEGAWYPYDPNIVYDIADAESPTAYLNDTNIYGGGGGSLKYVSELPPLTDSSVGDMYALRQFREILYLRLNQYEIDEGSIVGPSGVYIGSERHEYKWADIIAATDGSYGGIRSWFVDGYEFDEISYAAEHTQIGLDDDKCAVLYKEYVNAENPAVVRLTGRLGWNPRYIDTLYIRGDNEYKRIRTDGDYDHFGGNMKTVYLTSDEYYKVVRGLPDALYEFDFDTIYVITGKPAGEPEVYLANINLCAFPQAEGGYADCFTNGTSVFIRDVSNWDPTNLSTAGLKGSAALWDIDKEKHTKYAGGAYITEERTIPLKIKTPDNVIVNGICDIVELMPYADNDYNHIVIFKFTSTQTSSRDVYSFVRKMVVRMGADEPFNMGRFNTQLPDECIYDSGWHSPTGGGELVEVDNKTIEYGTNHKLLVKNEGITKSKINSEAGVVFEDDTQELKNKTIDATKNTFKNLSITAFGDNLIDKSALTTTDDNHLATSKLIKNYADTKISIPSTRANTVMAWNASGNTSVKKYVKQYEHFFAVKRTSQTVNYITFRYVDTTATPTVAQMIKWMYDHGFTSQDKLYPAAGLAAANTIYVASSSGGSPTTQFSATSCINGIYSPDGSKLCYTYRAGTNVDIAADRLTRITSIDRGYMITD